jgi:hypothetical protein
LVILLGAILCDCFHVRAIGDRVIFALADGCNWGERPRAAAEKASKAMVEYMSDALLQMEMKTSVECQQQLMRAFRVAHDKIIEGNSFYFFGRNSFFDFAIFMRFGSQRI